MRGKARRKEARRRIERFERRSIFTFFSHSDLTVARESLSIAQIFSEHQGCLRNRLLLEITNPWQYLGHLFTPLRSLT